MLPSAASTTRLSAVAVLVGVAVAVDVDLLGLPATSLVEARALAVLALLAPASEYVGKDAHGGLLSCDHSRIGVKVRTRFVHLSLVLVPKRTQYKRILKARVCSCHG